MIFSCLKISATNIRESFFFKLSLTVSMTVIIDDDCDDTIWICRSQKLRVIILIVCLKYARSALRLGGTAVYLYCCHRASKNRAAPSVFSACAKLMKRRVMVTHVYEPQAHSLPVSSILHLTAFKTSLEYGAVTNGLYFLARTCPWSDNKYTGWCLLCLSLDKPPFPGRRRLVRLCQWYHLKA